MSKQSARDRLAEAYARDPLLPGAMSIRPSATTPAALLLDINNVHVACTNQQWDPERYLKDDPLAHVREIRCDRGCIRSHARDSSMSAIPTCFLEQYLIDAH